MHLSKMRWGQVVYLRAYLETADLTATCDGVATYGLSEDVAAPIEDYLDCLCLVKRLWLLHNSASHIDFFNI